MTQLYLIRHGDSLMGEQDGKVVELGLSLEGTHQSELLRDRLARTGEIKADVLISSTAQRAQETAAIIAPALNAPLILDADLEEWRTDDGSLSEAEFNARWAAVPKDQKPFYRWMPGYENRLEFTLRVQLTLNRILQTYKDKTIVVVSHGAYIQVTFGFFFGYGEASLDRAVAEVRRTSITHWVQAKDETRWTL